MCRKSFYTCPQNFKDMRSCLCGNEIKPDATTNILFWDEDYCSRYCREFDEKGLEMENRGERLKQEGNKNWKNFKGFMDYPKIASDCICCGKEITLTKTQQSHKLYCGRACHSKIHRMPKARKSVFVFTMLRILKHRYLNYQGSEQWISGNAMYALMQKAGSHPYKNGYPNLMRIWASRGLLEMKSHDYYNDEGQKRTQNIFRFNPDYLDKPLGKAYYQCAGVPFDGE
jgi:hypothetical protein